MNKLLALLPLNVWLIVIGLVLAAAGGLYAMQASKLTTVQKELADSKVLLAQAREISAERAGKIATLTREASEKARAYETQLAKTAAENASATASNQTKIAELGAALADAQRRVRAPAIAAYATAGGTGPDRATTDPAPGLSFEARAQKLGLLLETCRAEVDSDAGELEQIAEQTRGLQRHVEVIERSYDDFWGSATEHR